MLWGTRPATVVRLANKALLQVIMMNRYNLIKCPQTIYCEDDSIEELANSVIAAISRELTTEQSMNLTRRITVKSYGNFVELDDDEYYAGNANDIQSFFENWLDFADFDAAFEELCTHESYDCGSDRICETCRFWSSCCKDQKDA